jgi:hypothetical protein
LSVSSPIGPIEAFGTSNSKASSALAASAWKIPPDRSGCGVPAVIVTGLSDVGAPNASGSLRKNDVRATPRAGSSKDSGAPVMRRPSSFWPSIEATLRSSPPL